MRWRHVIIAVFTLLAAEPAWAQAWRPEQIADLIRTAQAAPLEGLPIPEPGLEMVLMTEHLSDVDPSVAPARDLAAQALFVDLAQSFAQGGVDPTSVDHDWHITQPPVPDLSGLLSAVHAGAEPSVVLSTLLPTSDEYKALRTELARLRAAPSEPETNARLEQVLANLERWRWLPRTMPSRRIEVRLAQYKLYYFDGAHEQPTPYDVIVGAPRTPSPVFAATIESITLNPDWDPPQSIVTRELLPRFRRNPALAAEEGFDVLDGNGDAVDASLIDWQARPFPYHLRQRPGPQNPLGRLRFDLPNPFSVFLHDTPAQSLFLREERALSHGCIRVKTPASLAAALLGEPWTEAAIADAIAPGATMTIPLAQATPVYLLYLTVTTDETGTIVYLNDINHRDAAIAAGLGAPNTRAVAFAPMRNETCSP